MRMVELQATDAAVIIEVLAQADPTHASATRLRANLSGLEAEVHAAALDAGELPAGVSVEDLDLWVQMLALTLAKTSPEER